MERCAGSVHRFMRSMCVSLQGELAYLGQLLDDRRKEAQQLQQENESIKVCNPASMLQHQSFSSSFWASRIKHLTIDLEHLLDPIQRTLHQFIMESRKPSHHSVKKRSLLWFGNLSQLCSLILSLLINCHCSGGQRLLSIVVSENIETTTLLF